jgi:homoserine kinase
MRDVIVEPQRAPLVPGFAGARAAAMACGALGCSLAGSGPTLFAWVDADERAVAVRDGMIAAFAEQGVAADGWAAEIVRQGARAGVPW